ncbi:sensor histidine kinase [Streptomyces sp. NPDC051913]|uniref:sensor histidine kinase n=1 Tax=Streptomyces sp. NPDC051913 TaxID=3365676 RepID=UPI0037D6129F
MIENLRRSLRRHPRTADAASSAALLACSYSSARTTLPGQGPALPWWPAVLLCGVSCVALAGRRARLRTAVTVALCCVTVAIALGYLVTVLLLMPAMIALFSLAVRTDRRTANVFAFSGITLVTCTALAVAAYEPLTLKLLSPAFWLLLPTSLGTLTRFHRACLEAAQGRAEHAERTREPEALRRVTEERMRIARDLHDVVAHHLLLAKIQADAVARVLHTRPDEAARLAAELTDTASSALRELKATVGLLRHVDDPMEPQALAPGLARLPALIASFEAAGLRVTVTEEGEPRPLTAGVDLTGYRIVQEALTNVAKHAETGSAEVRLVHARDRLTLIVTDDGPGGGARHRHVDSGFGLVGMRERAHSVGGRLRAGPRARGGFEVVADLPLTSGTVGSPAVR